MEKGKIEKVYGIKEGNLYCVNVVKNTGKQLALEEGNVLGRKQVYVKDINQVFSKGSTPIVIAEDEDTAIKLWNEYVYKTIEEYTNKIETLKGWTK